MPNREAISKKRRRRCAPGVAFALIFVCGCKSAPRPTNPVSQYPSGLTATEIFNLRSKCSEMVDKQAADLGFVGLALSSDVYSHYNPNTNRCYAEVVATKNFAFDYKEHPVPDNYRTTAVYDAQTHRQIVFVDQEGSKSYASDWSRSDGSYEAYDEGMARVKELMQDDTE